MNRWRVGRALGVAVVAAVIAVGPGVEASAKDYHFTNVNIAISIRPDGSFGVREDRTFDFAGSFHRAFIDIPAGSYKIDSVRVSENGRAYGQVPSAGAETPGTYVFSTTDGYEIRWFFDAADQRRTFTIQYLVRGAITRFDDVAEFFWKFVGDQWTVPSDSVRATVTLPAGATRDQIRAWGHGPLDGEVTIVDGTTVIWSTPTLDAQTFVEGRLTFPPSLVPRAPHVAGEQLPSILAEETGLADEANGARSSARLWNILSPVIALVSFGFFLFLFMRYGKEPRAPDPGDYVREPPADYPPAVLGYLLRFGSVKPEDMVATLLDLARKRYIDIQEIRDEAGLIVKHPHYRYVIKLLKKADDSLAAYEADVLNLLHAAASGDSVSDEELHDWA